MRPYRGRPRGNRGFSRGGPRAPKHFQNNDRVQVWGDNTHLEPDYSYMSQGRGRGRGSGNNRARYGTYQQFHYRQSKPRLQAPVESYFKPDMLEDPWKDCTPIQVSEVVKTQAASSFHKNRLYLKINQFEGGERDGLDDIENKTATETEEAPDGKKIKVESTVPDWCTRVDNNPEEIALDSSDDDDGESKEPKPKKAKKEETEEDGQPEEELNDWQDASLDPQLIDLDPYEVQEARAANDMGSY